MVTLLFCDVLGKPGRKGRRKRRTDGGVVMSDTYQSLTVLYMSCAFF
jgi:hypothetical protein